MFNKPKDIYDFIGGNRLEWINEGSIIVYHSIVWLPTYL